MPPKKVDSVLLQFLTGKPQMLGTSSIKQLIQGMGHPHSVGKDTEIREVRLVSQGQWQSEKEHAFLSPPHCHPHQCTPSRLSGLSETLVKHLGMQQCRGLMWLSRHQA